MKKFLFTILFIFVPFSILASNDYVNTYGIRSNPYLHNSGHTISLFINTNYYYGDIEKPLDPNYTNLLFNIGNQIAGSCIISYAYRLNQYVGYRALLGFGAIRGKAEFNRETNLVQRKFSNIFILYNIGVEVYPFSRGFYLYAGIGGLTCISGKYDINWHNESIRETGNMLGNTAPTIPLGIGYKYNFDYILLGIEFSWYPILIDNYKWNIDAYPSKNYPVVPKTNAFTDGIFNLGINIGYIIPNKK